MADVSASPASQALMKMMRQRKNVEAASHFTVGVMGILLLYTLYSLAGPLYRRFYYGSRYNTAFRKPVEIARYIFLNSPGFISVGHAIIFALYFAISLSVLFTKINWTNLSGFAKRLGWLTVLNMGLTIFLGLKHTPLSLLTDQTYEKLNCLHQIAGYSSIASLLLHTIIYIISLAKIGKLMVVIGAKAQIMGTFAGLSLLIILFSALLLRKNYYEAFYVIHVSMVFLALVLGGLHRPKLSLTKSTYILIFAGSIWAADRFLRLVKYFIYSFGNTATITPLPHDGTRLVLNKTLRSVAPGQHCFIWLPAIRALETHPFTCVSTDPAEFIISAHNGFTRSLHDRALKEPGSILRASIDGPYGNPPDLTNFSKVVFIAGGSGASFTCSLAIDLVRKLGHSTKTSIDFTLVLKHKAMIEWVSNHMKTLASSPILNLHIHVTRKEPEDLSRNSFTPLTFNLFGSLPLDLFNSKSGSSDNEKTISTICSLKSLPNNSELKDNSNILLAPTNEKPMVLNSGRPDLSALISQAVNTSSTFERIAVVACGPKSMMVQVRRIVANNIRPEGPSLQLFNEQFGW